MKEKRCEEQLYPASWFAELCEVADIGRKAPGRRAGRAQGAKADKPKRYEPRRTLQDSEADCRTFAPAAANVVRHYLRSRCWARMLVWRIQRDVPTRQAELT